MKKIALLVTAIAVSLSIGGNVLADTNTTTFADKAGITPDNKILYSIDKYLDNLKVKLASGDEKKAEALVDVAEERLGESEVMADKEKTDLSAQTLTEYNDKMAEAQDKVDAALDKTYSSTTDNAKNLEKLEKLETKITDRQMKSIEVLKNIENKASENAKETLALVIEMQTRKKEAVEAVAKERQTLLADKKAVKEAEEKLAQAKKTGDELAIKAAEDILAQAQLTLATQNEKFLQVVATKKEAMKGGVGELKKQAKKEQAKDTESSTNSSTSEDVNTTTDNTTQGTVSNNTSVKNNTKPDVKVKENKGQEIKANKENNAKRNK